MNDNHTNDALGRELPVSNLCNFILCPSFHGATLLGLLLNAHSKVTSLGDTLPKRQHLDYFCSCEQRIQECAFWQTIMERVRTDRFPEEQFMLPIRARLHPDSEVNERLNLRLIKAARRFGPWVWRLRWRAAVEFRDMNLQLFRQACTLMGTEVFVDKSDIVRFAILRSVVYPQRVRVIHLTRDPRGYFFSMQKNRTPKWPLDRIVEKWVSAHSTVHGYQSLAGVAYLRVRYEDLCADPQTTLGRIFEFLGVDEEDVLQTLRDGTAEHHLIGNRMLRSFDGSIRLDTRWRETISGQRQAEVVARCGAWAKTFGYE